jgi:glycosyltransferase involved in cell wall biosynthesis
MGGVEDTPELLAGLDLLCSASRAEAFSNVIGEAMACGVSCVVTDVGDSALIVGDLGIVVPVGDLGALTRGILDGLGKSETERNDASLKTRERIRERYSMPRVAEVYGSLYTSS